MDLARLRCVWQLRADGAQSAFLGVSDNCGDRSEDPQTSVSKATLMRMRRRRAALPKLLLGARLAKRGVLRILAGRVCGSGTASWVAIAQRRARADPRVLGSESRALAVTPPGLRALPYKIQGRPEPGSFTTATASARLRNPRPHNPTPSKPQPNPRAGRSATATLCRSIRMGSPLWGLNP